MTLNILSIRNHQTCDWNPDAEWGGGGGGVIKKIWKMQKIKNKKN
jgi:hypothetical protein